MFPQIFGKYVLERELASGGMARVFLATLRGAGGFEKRLVVKQIRPELASDQSFIQRFVAEAKTTVELSHANIVPVYELGAEQGTYYIAMEFCAGVSLAELLRAGPASPAEGAYIGVEICRALDYAHRKAGVVHRDVTPRNVMIDPEGMVRLIDFGIAAPASADRSSGPAFGSPGHMPPEQLGPGPLTPAADVFAVAVLLVEAWTGRAPFRRESLAASARALREARPDLSAASPSLAPLEPLIRSALAHAASERPQTAEELARPLRDFLRQDDLGDIARRLGERVSDRLRALELASSALAERRSPRPSQPPRPSQAPRASQPPSRTTGSGPSGTQTFAARGALLEWTAKIESTPLRPSTSGPPPAGLEPGLAPPMPSGTPLTELESGLTAPAPSDVLRSPSSRSRQPAVSAAFALGVLALAALGGRAWLGARAAPGEGSPAHEAGAQAHEGGAPAHEAGASARAAPSAVVAQTNGATSNGASPPTVPATSDVPSSPPAYVSPAPPAALAALAARATNAPAPTPARTPSPLAPATSAASKPSSTPRGAGADPVNASRGASAGAPAALVRLQLTADPAAWVEIDAVRIGRTPLARHGVRPGPHSIVFVNQLLGERLEATVNVDPDHPASVHADFSSANPRVYVR